MIPIKAIQTKKIKINLEVNVGFICFVFVSFSTFVLSFVAQWMPTFSLLLNTRLSIVCCIRDIISS